MNTSELFGNIFFTGGVLLVVIFFGIIALVSKFYKKAAQGQALVRTGLGGTKVSFNGMLVIPVVHKLEIMDISLKNIEIGRDGADGLICADNMRADIKVAFFVRVNKSVEDVIKVAQSVGCTRAASKAAVNDLFEAKFSEALKTVGKQFNFVELYNEREKFKLAIIDIIGTDLNGFVLDDAAIDFLEQTNINALSPKNILDAEGIKKITELTAKQNILSNQIKRDEEKIITQQDVETREAILEMERHLAEKEEKQAREIANIKSRETAEIQKVSHEELLKSEKARIATEEEVMISEENKLRQIIVSEKNKERTLAVETERVEKDRALEMNERQRIVTLAQIDKEKAIEIQRKNIQEVIRERIAIEKTVVDEEEKIKDTKAFAEADRSKTVAITNAEQLAEQQLVQQIKAADASKQAAEFEARKKIIDAEAGMQAANQEAEAIKILADAEATQKAAIGLSEAKVMTAKAKAVEDEGNADAAVIEATARAEASGILIKSEAQAKANANIGFSNADVIKARAKAEEEKGLAEANVMGEKYSAEAKGIEEKAAAMKKLDGVGKEHEEFKLKLSKEKEIELAQISIQKDIADAQATVLSSALKSANIDIVGGEPVFFDKIIGSISNAKAIDKYVDKSKVINDVKNQLMNTEDGTNLVDKIKGLIAKSGLKSEDIQNFTVSSLLLKLMSETKSSKDKNLLTKLIDLATKSGLGDSKANSIL